MRNKFWKFFTWSMRVVGRIAVKPAPDPIYDGRQKFIGLRYGYQKQRGQQNSGYPGRGGLVHDIHQQY
ncbi:protein of unassigned function [Methylobacterium oryzae CBMB20]|uniref:Protein of unassigned function n=1 Tax=Methylobacterium oryzae CBMB20 TaxID=693986 RepID=A0A089NYH3_9HYPH|nr:protein of unassigned function [Methylobacterium oryzae CBMB20]